MNTETVETNIYSQQDAAKFAQACQSDLLNDIQIGTENYNTLVVTARFTQKDSAEQGTIHIGRDSEDNALTVICNRQRLHAHDIGVMKLEGDDEATVHANMALADAQRLYDAAVLLQERIVEDATAQLVTSLTGHAARFSTPEGRQLTPEEM
jgi:hypothetical protein